MSRRCQSVVREWVARWDDEATGRSAWPEGWGARCGSLLVRRPERDHEPAGRLEPREPRDERGDLGGVVNHIIRFTESDVFGPVGR